MRYLRNKEMSDPNWVHRKQQDYFNLKAALQRFEWGGAFIPEACRNALWNIQMEIARMDEPIKAWKAEKPEYMTLRKPRAGRSGK